MIALLKTQAPQPLFINNLFVNKDQWIKGNV